MRQEEERRWLVWEPTREALEAKVGPATVHRIGVIAKIRAGVEKLRLIHDLRRSGVNQRVKCKERLVLPRISDLMQDILDVIELAGPEGGECMILDFADAFRQLPVAENERRFLGGQALGGF